MKSIGDLFYARPWAIKEELLAPMSEVVLRHMRGESLSAEKIEAIVKRDGKPVTPDYEVVNGVARIPIYGIIAKRASMVNNTSQAQGTSIEEIKKNMQAALKDPAVQSIALDVDSPGGSVDGTDELSSYIYAARKKKQIYAYANGQMDSAAYYIASAAHKIFASPSSEVGSIGVYSTIVDWSVANHNMGAKVSVIRAGSQKATGHPDRPFTEEDRAIIQEEINSYYDLFVNAVSRNRGISKEAALKISTGRVWIGVKALDAGLIDGIEAIDSIFSGDQNGGPAAKASGLTASEINKNHGNQAGKPKTEDEQMGIELKDITLSEFRAGRPDLAAALIKEGQDKGIEDGKALSKADASAAAEVEKSRVSAISAKAKEIQTVDHVALECIVGGLSVEAADLKMRTAKLEALQKSSQPAMGGGNSDVPAKTESAGKISYGEDPTGEKHRKAAETYKAEHKCSMTVALNATAPSR